MMQISILTRFRDVMCPCILADAAVTLAVLDGRGEEIGYGEKQTTRTSSLIFLSFVEILAMITSYRNKAYLLICEKFQKDKHCRLAVR